MCVVITKEYLCRGNLNKYIYLLGLLDSPFKLLKTSIKGHVRKNCFGTIVYQCVSKAKLAWKLLFAKWFNNLTQAQLNRNQDFLVLVLDLYRASIALSAG